MYIEKHEKCLATHTHTHFYTNTCRSGTKLDFVHIFAEDLTERQQQTQAKRHK